MIREFSAGQLGVLNEGMKAISEKNHLAHFKLTEELLLIRNILSSLTEYVREHPFMSVDEEVEFHKQIYPQFRCLYIYHAEVHNLTQEVPDGDRKSIRKYYRTQMNIIGHYIHHNQFHYRYFKLKGTELDRLYFTSTTNKQSVLIPVLAELSGEHSTIMGYLFARFRAYELLYHYILMKLDELQPNLPGSPIRKTLKWSGETVNLIELAHGVHLNKQINNGDIGIVEFFENLGEFFGVNLGVPKKGFDDLKKRKRLSKTNFIDHMRDAILQRMDDEDAYDPHKSTHKGNHL
ncbi:RteC domain-containing protein [Pedobacter mendelii]|uniref:RteC protein n=1 Tax=Pedobacter mendelii TaxID=1908240 RepID=A0ABQ2BFP9_9SPHI|nr:RteC domain-containing protein [Pedobacter mendelii]GGI23325.1 hypothetical protein GCM10008119_07080 [Pedobacter mendelii]